MTGRDEHDRCTGCLYSAGHALDCPLYPQAEGREQTCRNCDTPLPAHRVSLGLDYCTGRCYAALYQSGPMPTAEEVAAALSATASSHTP